MTTFADAVSQFGGVPVGSGLGQLGLAGGKWYFFDPSGGSDSNDGLTPTTAKATLLAAYNLCRDGENDGVIFLGGASGYEPAAAFVWAKSYCHLIGATNGLFGMGQRARIVNAAANDLAVLFTLSGSGCLISNVQFFDGKDKDEDGACVLVSGSRNKFVNSFIAGIGHATPGARAGSYSLKVSGAENEFVECTVGLDTILRAAANAELIVSGPRNNFRNCEIRSYSETAGKFLVKIDNSTADLRDTIFEDCLFFNYTVNWATGITDAFDMPAGGNTHYVILKGNCVLVGVGTGWADTVTHLYGAGPAPNAGYGVAVAPTT
jgi:hypothetical protein